MAFSGRARVLHQKQSIVQQDVPQCALLTLELTAARFRTFSRCLPALQERRFARSISIPASLSGSRSRVSSPTFAVGEPQCLTVACWHGSQLPGIIFVGCALAMPSHLLLCQPRGPDQEAVHCVGTSKWSQTQSRVDSGRHKLRSSTPGHLSASNSNTLPEYAALMPELSEGTLAGALSPAADRCKPGHAEFQSSCACCALLEHSAKGSTWLLM